MGAKYVFRIDDIVPGMNWDNFGKIEKIFGKYGVKPIIGVVPDNQDLSIGNNKYTKDFWNKINSLAEKGWIIAQHGYHHKYVNKNGGILNVNHYGEFAGLSYEKQYEMIKNGKDILEKNLNIKIKWRMAPAHSFDQTTCNVLTDLGFEYITDGISLYPFTKYGLKWLPQQIWKPIKKRYGVWTICLHVNHYDDKFIASLGKFIERENISFINPKTLDYKCNLLRITYSQFYKIKYYSEQFLYKFYINLRKFIKG